jgi:hypothetical protein
MRITQKGGVQSIDGCRNAANELVKSSLTTLENELGEPKMTGLEIIESALTFAVEQELMG